MKRLFGRRGFVTMLSFTGVGLGAIALWEVVKRNLRPLPSPLPGTSLKSFGFETVKVNERGEVVSRSQQTASSFTEDLGGGVALEMVAVRGGRFKMGLSSIGIPDAELNAESDEDPQHEVTIKPFYMGKFEVTQAQYQAIMGKNPSKFKGANRPVETVSWNDAVEFCRRLSQKTGRAYRLPSEAEWEYSVRADTTTPFYFGETITTDLVNYNGHATYGAAPEGVKREGTTDVGSFPPNSFGLYDMHGNVSEWCQDRFFPGYYGAPTDGSAWIENKRWKDRNDDGYEERTKRGGSWFDAPQFARCAGRYGSDITNPDYYGTYGFRVALSPWLHSLPIR